MSIDLESRDVPLGLDDVVVRRRSAREQLIQAKGSLSASSVLSTRELITVEPRRTASLLQRLFSGWQRLVKAGRQPEVILATTRSLDPGDALLRERDHHGHVNLARVRAGSTADQVRVEWRDHLGCTDEELAAFLKDLRIDTDSSLGSARETLGHFLQLSGYKSDDAAIDQVVAIGRGWIEDARMALTPGDIAAALAPLHVGAIVPIVQIDAIDPDPVPTMPAAAFTIDWRIHYEGSRGPERLVPRTPTCGEEMLRDLDELTRMVQVQHPLSVAFRGSLHLPQWFAVGATFRRVAKHQVELVRPDGTWSSGQALAEVPLGERRHEYGAGDELAVAVEISGAIEEEVDAYVRKVAAPLRALVTLSKSSTVMRVASAAEAESLAVAVRDRIRSAVVRERASRLHLFIHAPDFFALFLGHHWDRLAVQTYEWLGTGQGYSPTIFVAR